jgi:hypothetical protein
MFKIFRLAHKHNTVMTFETNGASQEFRLRDEKSWLFFLFGRCWYINVGRPYRVWGGGDAAGV